MKVCIDYDGDRIKLSVSKHVDEFFHTADLKNCNPATLPHHPKADLITREQGEQMLNSKEHKRYRKVFGELCASYQTPYVMT